MLNNDYLLAIFNYADYAYEWLIANNDYKLVEIRHLRS